MPLTDAKIRNAGAGAGGLLQRFQMLVYPDEPASWRNIDRYPNSEARNTAFWYSSAEGVFQKINLAALATLAGVSVFRKLTVFSWLNFTGSHGLKSAGYHDTVQGPVQ